MRQCPFPGCSEQIADDRFACRHHWHMMSEAHRVKAHALYENYKAGIIGLETLRDEQAKIVKKYATDNLSNQALVTLARAFLIFLAKRKEYTACKDGYLQTKQRLGRELGKLENDLAVQCKAIVHPKQKQPTLFDAAVEDKPKLPD